MLKNTHNTTTRQSLLGLEQVFPGMPSNDFSQKQDAIKYIDPLQKKLTESKQISMQLFFHKDEQLLLIKQKKKIIPISADEIVRIKAVADYIKIFYNDIVRKSEEMIMLVCTMKSVAEALKPTKCQRVHRSHVVHCEKMQKCGNAFFLKDDI